MKKRPFVTLEKLQEITKEIPTPFHLYDEKGIRENAAALKAAFSWNPGFKEFFAVKATPNPFLIDILREYGFSFFDLAEASPKAEKTKRCCARAVNWMLAVAERILQMRRSRSLPVAAISAALEIARKILERHRRYIIASTEILDGDFPYLAEYLEYIRKERA